MQERGIESIQKTWKYAELGLSHFVRAVEESGEYWRQVVRVV